MKTVVRLVVLLLFIAVFCGSGARGSEMFDIGVKGGLNLASLRGDDLTELDSRTGAVFGGFARLRINDMFAVQPELLYSMKGAEKDIPELAKVGTPKWTYAVDYLDIPVLLRFSPRSAGNLSFGIFAGPVVSVKLSSSMTLEFIDESYDLDISNAKSADFGLAFGGDVDFGLGKVTAVIDVRYTLGLGEFLDDGTYYEGLDIPDEIDLVNPDGSAWDLKHGALSVMLGLEF